MSSNTSFTEFTSFLFLLSTPLEFSNNDLIIPKGTMEIIIRANWSKKLELLPGFKPGNP